MQRHAVLFLVFLAACSNGASCSCKLGGASRDKLVTLIKGFTASNGLPAKAVTCPDPLPEKSGDIFECQVELAVGTFPVTVTVKENNNVNVNWKEHMVGGDMLESLMVKSFADTADVTITAIECGDDQVLIARPDSRATCKVVQGMPGQVEAIHSGDGLKTHFTPATPPAEAPAPPPAP